ncbi:unnamed protein product [Nippostrongylus brasiliensis]|uniref:Ovule protein n=1 Tax=Nippostrongylus brasiliensis TaxID=27835 RepID=A0A0N4YLD7_NIPBR|nr:unnamed protein product [Nippostrongylus brasiliensis]
MFLIAKIVRGRRLLLELEQQEKDEAAAALEAVNNISQVLYSTSPKKLVVDAFSSLHYKN